MKIIKTESEYENALNRIEEIIDIDPDENTPLADELELLLLLVGKYEDEIYKIDYPDPIDAIRFRMEQQGLKNADLVPFIGSKSKVSEVMNRKRTLSLSMIRKLNKGLGIPAEVLISDTDKILPDEIEGIDWKKFPLAEMLKNEWVSFDGTLNEAKDRAEELVREFFSQAPGDLSMEGVFFRKSIRSDSKMDEYSLSVWLAQVMIVASRIESRKTFRRENLTGEFLDELKRLSSFEQGPLLARELLLKIGIKLVILQNIKGIHLDGASLISSEDDALIVLTLRYDRVDYFWFTLFHELGHLVKHIRDESEYYIDDLKSNLNITDKEKEADLFAEESLITSELWDDFYSDFLSKEDILDFAEKHRISPAIVVGRIQKYRDDYRFLRPLLGSNSLRPMFGLAV